jgi:ATP-dependent helicase/nuclease subunit A
MPCVAAFEKAAGDLGLWARALTADGGDVQAGSLAKAMELLRAAQKEKWTLADMVDYLGRLVYAEETYDGVSAQPQEGPGVRVMNLHKVKGLEAPRVFLVDPARPMKAQADIHIDRSGTEVVGYVPILGELRGFQRPLLAQPPDWENLSEREERFLEAERKRLFYVAATRAGVELTVVKRVGSRADYTWKFFEAFLEGCPKVEDPGDVSPPEVEEDVIDPGDVGRAAAQRDTQWAAVSRPTFAMKKAKELEEVPDYSGRSSGEHGMEWGTVMHALLEALMRDPDQPIDALADSVLTDNHMDLARKDEAIRQARKVMESDLWKQAQDSDERYVEVPVQVLLREEGTETPTVMRGVIDLVFREKDAWTIVDYKTDDTSGPGKKSLDEKYKKQLDNYEQAWKQVTGSDKVEARTFLV